jgi:hypothetical protein
MDDRGVGDDTAVDNGSQHTLTRLAARSQDLRTPKRDFGRRSNAGVVVASD